MIVEIFSEVIAEGVKDLTRLNNEIKTTAADTVNHLFEQYKFDILNIKIFDRLHNIRTISAMKPEKARKIIQETLVHFVLVASRLQLHEISEELEILCLEASLSFMDARQLLLDDSEISLEDSDLIFFLISQNEITQKQNLKLLE
jgi:(p)ppGpp synthase/HD superfamily hydrolase